VNVENDRRDLENEQHDEAVVNPCKGATEFISVANEHRTLVRKKLSRAKRGLTRVNCGAERGEGKHHVAAIRMHRVNYLLGVLVPVK